MPWASATDWQWITFDTQNSISGQKWIGRRGRQRYETTIQQAKSELRSHRKLASSIATMIQQRIVNAHRRRRNSDIFLKPKILHFTKMKLPTLFALIAKWIPTIWIRAANCCADFVPSCERPIASLRYCYKHEQCGMEKWYNLSLPNANNGSNHLSDEHCRIKRGRHNDGKHQNLMLTRALNIT